MKEDQIFCLFIPGVTQGNQDAMGIQGFIFLLLILIKGITRYSECKIPLPNPAHGGKLLFRFSMSYNKLLGSDVSRTLLNISDEAFLQNNSEQSLRR